MLKSTYKPARPPPPLPAGWTEHKAPTGYRYYYYAATRESTYTRPGETQQSTDQTPGAIEAIVSKQVDLRGNNGTSYSGPLFPNPAGSNDHQFGSHSSYRARGHFNGGHNRQQRPQPSDRPKSKHPVPGCEPWLLVYTKLGRRFLHNPHQGESFWKFPLDVMKGVIEYDRIQRENKIKKQTVDSNGGNDAELLAEFEETTAVEGPTPTAAPAPARIMHVVKPSDAEVDSEEYEEVEVTDDEGEENPSKRHKMEGGDADQPVEFNEDDIAYQLAAMGRDYGLDPGEYGIGEDEDLEEGAEGLALTAEESSALFKDMLDDQRISPYTPWDKILEAGHIIEDDRYVVLPNMRSRKEVWEEWNREMIRRLKEQKAKQEKQDLRLPYLSFLQKQATPKLYWPEFRRKYKKEPEMRDAKVADKEREKWYRNYINRLKIPESTQKADLVTLLKSTPLHLLNRSTNIEALPSPILTDLRYVSLRSSVRDPMIETYIASLPHAPDTTDVSPEEAEARVKEKREREKRENALRERQMQVQDEKRRQRGQLQASKGMLRDGEEEVQRAMRIGKEGLRGYMEERDVQGREDR